MMHKLLLPALLALLSAPAFAQNNPNSPPLATAPQYNQTPPAPPTQATTAPAEPEKENKISRGGLFVEPLLQTSREDSTIATSQLPVISDDTSGRTEGYGLGAKLGVHLTEVFFLGADARYSRLKMTDSAYQSAEGDSYNYGPTAGLQMPVFGLRLLGTYVMGGEYNPGSGAQGVDLKFRDPKGWRLGAGLRLAAVSVNLEYQDLKFDKTEVESFGSLGGGSDTNVDFSNRGYTLSLSFPVEL